MTKIQHTPPQVSRKHINKAGAILSSGVQNSEDYKEALKVANSWRLAHLHPMSALKHSLTIMTEDTPNSIVAQRLKRMPTIIDKLKRHKNMKLSTMQDIGGVRAILKDINAVNSLVDRLENGGELSHKLKAKDDYILKPKHDGYRGIHLIYRYTPPSDSNNLEEKFKDLLIEVQVRTQEQHIWSTAVETMGTILKQPFKTRGGNKEWGDFFALASSIIAIIENEGILERHSGMSPQDMYVELAKQSKHLRALDLMTGYGFAAKIVHSHKLEHYNIIQLDIAKKEVSIDSFEKDKYKEATDRYAQIENSTRNDITKDAVMVSVSELNNLREAYPNYFLDIEEFAKRLQAIVANTNEIE